jgi:hypothetical protein
MAKPWKPRILTDEEMKAYRGKAHEVYRIAMNARSDLERYKTQGTPQEQARAERLGRRTRDLLEELKIKSKRLRPA